MSRSRHISWQDVLDLRVVQTLGRYVFRRWNIGLGFVDLDGSLMELEGASLCRLLGHEIGAPAPSLARVLMTRFVDQPSPSQVHSHHNGLLEVVAPIVIDGKPQGFVLAGGYLSSHNGSREEIMARLQARGPVALELEVELSRVALLTTHDEGYLRQLVELLAQEIVGFQLELASTERRLDALEPARPTRYSYDNIIGRSVPMLELYQLLDKVIGSDSTVLIQGENGTGKELIAKAIHYNSWRKDRRFVVQNCSAFNDNLLDSELFGHKKGAFTGAISDKQGLFEVADGSTFFLDEIGDMSPSLQVKLLRVLQEGTFIPVGDTQPKKVDVRIIAATNRDLKRMVQQGEFREDLYYRINVINIRIPRLRERKEDIPLLVDHFLRKQAKGSRARLKKLTRDCLRRLLEYNWPGNIRELENEIERMVVLAGDEKLIGEELLSSRIRQPPPQDDLAHGTREPSGLPEAIEALERNMIYDVLKRNHWNKTRAAHELRISRRNLIRKVNKYKLDQRRAR
jgi:two-component system response regulator HupR/HoxA